MPPILTNPDKTNIYNKSLANDLLCALKNKARCSSCSKSKELESKLSLDLGFLTRPARSDAYKLAYSHVASISITIQILSLARSLSLSLAER